MTPTEQIEKLDDRVTRLEDRYQSDVVAIHVKLDALATLLNKSFVEQAKNSCPSPGACITLAADLKGQIVAHNATMLRVERLELRMMDLEKWQGRLLGGLSVVMVFLTLFGPALRKMLKLE